MAGAYLAPACLLPLPSPPLFSSSSPFFLLPTPSFPSPSFGCVSSGYETWHLCLRKVDGGGLVGLMDTGRLWGGGGAASIGVALRTLLYVV